MIKSRDLLPGYMNEEIWLDLADAIDELYGDEIEGAMKCMQYLRFMYIPTETVEARVSDQKLISYDMFDMPERTVAINQANMQGLTITKPAGLSQLDFININRNISGFWYSKGTLDFIDFLGYCLNTELSMVTMWSSGSAADYETFLPEGDPGIGTTIWEGGVWFPTTHVSISWDFGKFSVPLANVVSLFNDVSNYNLVLYSVSNAVSLWIAPRDASFAQYPNVAPANIVSAVQEIKSVFTIKNYT